MTKRHVLNPVSNLTAYSKHKTKQQRTKPLGFQQYWVVAKLRIPVTCFWSTRATPNVAGVLALLIPVLVHRRLPIFVRTGQSRERGKGTTKATITHHLCNTPLVIREFHCLICQKGVLNNGSHFRTFTALAFRAVLLVSFLLYTGSRQARFFRA